MEEEVPVVGKSWIVRGRDGELERENNKRRQRSQPKEGMSKGLGWNRTSEKNGGLDREGQGGLYSSG
ncbi:hypothetical protein MLD38_028686 [Melastoma candidum]|uniref:Uncharacterized protein n=1 Tax=Melastoma candidum TaxID=119954 RepID=A0ACB9N2C1_9MYRT|nr:hypothetical protein MLD38_028686 [Melastoma candidum]